MQLNRRGIQPLLGILTHAPRPAAQSSSPHAPPTTFQPPRRRRTQIELDSFPCPPTDSHCRGSRPRWVVRPCSWQYPYAPPLPSPCSVPFVSRPRPPGSTPTPSLLSSVDLSPLVRDHQGDGRYVDSAGTRLVWPSRGRNGSIHRHVRAGQFGRGTRVERTGFRGRPRLRPSTRQGSNGARVRFRTTRCVSHRMCAG